MEICFYSEDNGDYRGGRICNAAMANGVVSILIAMELIMIDLMVPCLNAKVCMLFTHIRTCNYRNVMHYYRSSTEVLYAHAL